ncbi:E3 ubiquitin-protein ligase AMFR-like [Liolophura sinensis]|uniref:E3 ubiquitin-protein ligase AMFR-like n=1 Tax=Liolophura sinensis TaxID=3198878 RepID=UPI0031598725
MPVIILDRIPLPSLQAYTAFSVLLLSCALFYTHQIVSNVETDIGENNMSPGSQTVTPVGQVTQTGRQPRQNIAQLTEEGEMTEKPNHEAGELFSSPADPFRPPEKGDNPGVSEMSETDNVEMEELDEPVNYTLPYDNYVANMFYVMTVEIWCVWTLINMAFCCLILLGKVIQKVVFGELRVSELQHLKDKFWNFVFYKFIFVFGVMNVQTMEEVVLWVAWFTMLGFFHLLAQLCKDRFEYLSFSPTTPKWVHIKLLSLLFCILLACVGLMLVCVLAGLQAGITIFCFMTAECLLLSIRSLHVVVRYAIHLWDMNLEGVWENRSFMAYYTELFFELSALSIDFAHHLHMLLWGNIFLSMASLVICMQLRYLFHEFQRRIKRHKNYLQVVHNMESRFTMASKEDLEKNNDDCAICWERMEVARKLPCGHLFHNSCLRSWLEQDTSCPTCRMALNERPEGDPNGNNIDGRGDAPNNVPQAPPGNTATTNHFFHFDASRYVSWLPSFSVEVTHTQLLPGQQMNNAFQTSQLDNMARQVQNVFQHMPLNVIMDDLHITRSVDHTIDNILEGRLVAPSNGTFPARSTVDPSGSETDVDQDRQIVLPSVVSRTGATALQAEIGRRSSEQYEHVSPDLAADTEASDSDLATCRGVANLMERVLESDTDNNTNVLRGGEMPSATGSRFSKSPSERETMLQDRKNALMEQARRRFLAMENSKPGETSSLNDSNSSPDPEGWLRRRGEGDQRDPRELAFLAAQRRLYQQHH